MDLSRPHGLEYDGRHRSPRLTAFDRCPADELYIDTPRECEVAALELQVWIVGRADPPMPASICPSAAIGGADMHA